MNVVPAQAGIQVRCAFEMLATWVPAFAGTTRCAAMLFKVIPLGNKNFFGNFSTLTSKL
jgi:hypothetical protein